MTLLILNIVNIDILNIKQLSHLILVLKLQTSNRQFFAETNDITNKASQNKIFSFLCIAIHLAEYGTRMDGIWFRLSPSIF